MSEDIDDNIPILFLPPQDRLGAQMEVVKRQRTEPRKWYLCKSACPKNMDWSPPKRNFKNGFIISLENEPHDNESQVPDRTHGKKRHIFVKSSNTGTNEQLDSLDHVFAQTSRYLDGRRTSAAEIFSTFVNRTANIPNWLNAMRKLIDRK